MSQITTCPSCSTRFRVVADQLRISDGWVRCGQCQEVFDARDHLDAAVAVEPVVAPEPVAAASAVAHTGMAGAPAEPVAPVAEEVVTEPEGKEPSQPVPDMPVPASEPVPAPVIPPAPGYELPAPQWSDDPDLLEHPAEQGESVPEAAQPLRPSHAPEEPDPFPNPDPAPQLPLVAPAAPVPGRTEPVWNASAAAPAEVARQEPSASADALAATWATAERHGLQGAAPAQDGRSDAARVGLPEGGDDAEPVAPVPPPAAADVVAASTTPALPLTAAKAAEAVVYAAEPVDAGAAMPPVDAIESAAQKLAQSEAGVSSAAAPAFPFAEPVDDDDPLVLDSSLEPGFVRDARRKAWWQKPVVRVAMGASVVVLPVALVLQVALHERNALAAWQPSLRPALEFMCTALQCKLGPRQQIAAMVVSGSTFAKGERERAYQLSLSIQNRAGTPVGMPAVELTLTDAQDQAIARKVIQAKELGAPPELKAGAEWSGTVPVTTEGLNLQVSGYRVLLFYP